MKVVTILIVTLLTCSNVIAYIGDKELLGLSLTDLLNVEVEIASKTKETVADAPSSVTVFTQDEIRNMGISTLYELLNYVPGFQASQDISYSRAERIAARGRSTPASESVLVLIDGHRLNDANSSSATVFSPRIIVENIQQIEIIRGPGSALYGSSAFLGVINIITLTDSNYAALKLGDTDQKLSLC